MQTEGHAILDENLGKPLLSNLMFPSFKDHDRIPVHDDVVAKRANPRSNGVKAERI